MKILNVIKYLLAIIAIIFIFFNWKISIILFIIGSLLHVFPLGPNPLLSVITGELIISGVIFLFISWKIGVALIIGGLLVTKFRIWGNKKNTIDQVKTMVFSSDRSMPAHFTSDKERSQSFCIDSNLIETNDEYNMASESYYKFYDFLKDEAAGNGLIILKIGEDIMIGSYIINKLGHSKLANELKQSLINENIDQLDQDVSDFVNGLLKLSETQQYLEYCMTYGKDVALTK